MIFTQNWASQAQPSHRRMAAASSLTSTRKLCRQYLMPKPPSHQLQTTRPRHCRQLWQKRKPERFPVLPDTRPTVLVLSVPGLLMVKVARPTRSLRRNSRNAPHGALPRLLLQNIQDPAGLTVHNQCVTERRYIARQHFQHGLGCPVEHFNKVRQPIGFTARKTGGAGIRNQKLTTFGTHDTPLIERNRSHEVINGRTM